MVAIGVRYLAGEPYIALNDIANISTTLVYRFKNRFLSTLFLSEDQLKIKLPGDAEEWERVRQGFENISSYGIFKNSVRAMDSCLFQLFNQHIWLIATLIQWHVCLVMI